MCIRDSTYSVVEIPKPHLEPPPPPLEEIKEEPEHESQQQLSEQDDVTVAKENQSALIHENKLFINNCCGIEIAECDDTTTSPGTRMEYDTTVEMKSVPKPHVNPQVDIANDNTMDIQPDDEETPLMFEAGGEPEEAAPPTTNTVSEMETHND